MTERMVEAGVNAYSVSDDTNPEELVQAIYKAMKDAKQKEALETYWKQYDG